MERKVNKGNEAADMGGMEERGLRGGEEDKGHQGASCRREVMI